MKDIAEKLLAIEAEIRAKHGNVYEAIKAAQSVGQAAASLADAIAKLKHPEATPEPPKEEGGA